MWKCCNIDEEILRNFKKYVKFITYLLAILHYSKWKEEVELGDKGKAHFLNYDQI